MTRDDFNTAAARLYDYCESDAVRYKIITDLAALNIGQAETERLHDAFADSDIYRELEATQYSDGGWGRLQSKDYSVKARFPTSYTAIDRCKYIGMKYGDEVLERAYRYLENFLLGKNTERLHNSNERDVPWQTASICTAIETIKPNNSLCDNAYSEWQYIISRSYEYGEYSYERERDAQHEVFGTKEDRLVPMQFGLLLARRENVSPELEAALLHHHGEHSYYHGHFWDNCPEKLPSDFVYNKTRRWFHSFNYIAQFKGSSYYLADAVKWLWDARNSDGLWDFGTQIKDPWGYFGYFSTSRMTAATRTVDCTVEVLSFLRKYLDNNE